MRNLSPHTLEYYRENLHYIQRILKLEYDDELTKEKVDEAHHWRMIRNTWLCTVAICTMEVCSALFPIYRKRRDMEEHQTVYLNTLYRQEEYEVIGVFLLPIDVQSEGYVPYTGTRKFQTLAQFYGFADNIRENAPYWKDGAEMRAA